MSTVQTNLPDVLEEVEVLTAEDLQAQSHGDDAGGNGKDSARPKQRQKSAKKQPEEEQSDPLFRGRPVEVLGVTGAYNSGKTLFLLSISPRETRYYDFEKSGAGHAVSLGATRIDVPSVMQQKYRDGHSPVDVFEWWLKDVQKIPPGEYRVICVDTIGDIEIGLPSYVAQHRYKEHGFSSPDKFQAMGGVFWGAVKAFWKQVLADIASRCELFAFSSHLKTKYRGQVATSEKTPTGKSTLMELASLYIWLEREQSEVPSGTILKSRLSDSKIVDGRLVAVDILPPRMPEASYYKICWYCDHPAGADLKDDEKVQERHLSEDERLMIRSEIAANERAAKEAELAATEASTQKRGRAMRKKSTADIADAATQGDVQESPQEKASKTDLAKPESPAKLASLPPSESPADTAQLDRIRYLKKESGIPDDQYKSILNEYGVKSAKDLTYAKCSNLIEELTSLFQKSDLDEWSEKALHPKH